MEPPSKARGVRERGLLALLVVALAAPAWADGKIVTTLVAAPPVQMPGQRALVVFADGVETLVVETDFEAAGTELAWIVPLPAPPTRIAAATAGLLTTLEILCRPQLVRGISPGIILFGLLALLLIAGTWHRSDRGTLWGCLGGMVVIASISIAGGNTLGLPPIEGPGVEVIAEQTVGAFETVTLAASDAGALATWMDGHGYQAPGGFREAAADYVARGFAFVAMRLRRDLEPGVGGARTHPVAFTFPAAQPIYPMQLTGAGATEPLELELFVVADSRARVQGLEVTTCARTSGEGRVVPLDHPGLAELAGGRQVVTRLEGLLTPAQMSRDLEVELVPFRAAHPIVFARLAALEIGFALTILGALAALLVSTRRERGRRRRGLEPDPAAARTTRAVVYPMLVALVVLPILVLPATSVREIRGDAPRIESTLRRRVFDQVERAAPESQEAIREIAVARAGELPNAFTGEPIVYEDSPGNFTLEQTGQEIHLVVHDQRGRPMPKLLWILPERPSSR